MAKKRSGTMNVLVAPLSEDAREIRVPKNATLRTALTKAGYAEDQLDELLSSVRVNGAAAELGQRLKARDFITIAPNVAGGR